MLCVVATAVLHYELPCWRDACKLLLRSTMCCCVPLSLLPPCLGT
jgi:hypothetical protein